MYPTDIQESALFGGMIKDVFRLSCPIVRQHVTLNNPNRFRTRTSRHSGETIMEFPIFIQA